MWGESVMGFLSLRSFGRRDLADEVKPGDSYRRRQGSYVAETATVLAIRPDLVGIPHVFFKLAFECSDSNYFEDGSRALALDAFLAVYRERIRYRTVEAPAPESEPATAAAPATA
jgi:hypothetical protein